MKTKVTPALKAQLLETSKTLETFDLLREAIRTEVLENLQGWVRAHEQTEWDLADSEIKAALSGQRDSSYEVGRKKLTEIRSQIDASTAKLRGLRSAIAGLGTELAQRHDCLNATIPDFLASVKEEFAREWGAAVAAFSVVLGQRRELELLFGEPFELPEPMPAAASDIGDLGEPQKKLDLIAGALSDIVVMREAQSEQRSQYMVRSRIALPPYAAYRLANEVDDLPAGTWVMEPSLLPGQLADLVRSGVAVMPQDERIQQAMQDARMASGRIESERSKRHERVAQEQRRKDRERMVSLGQLLPLGPSTPCLPRE